MSTKTRRPVAAWASTMRWASAMIVDQGQLAEHVLAGLEASGPRGRRAAGVGRHTSIEVDGAVAVDLARSVVVANPNSAANLRSFAGVRPKTTTSSTSGWAVVDAGVRDRQSPCPEGRSSSRQAPARHIPTLSPPARATRGTRPLRQHQSRRRAQASASARMRASPAACTRRLLWTNRSSAAIGPKLRNRAIASRQMR